MDLVEVARTLKGSSRSCKFHSANPAKGDTPQWTSLQRNQAWKVIGVAALIWEYGVSTRFTTRDSYALATGSVTTVVSPRRRPARPHSYGVTRGEDRCMPANKAHLDVCLGRSRRQLGELSGDETTHELETPADTAVAIKAKELVSKDFSGCAALATFRRFWPSSE